MRKITYFIIISLIMASFLMANIGRADAQFMPSKPRPKPKDKTGVKLDNEKYKPAGIAVGNTLIRPGNNLSIVWGVMGPPDQVHAMRGKDEAGQDYVKLAYYSYGMSIDINNKTNNVQGILIEENNSGYKLVNVPFAIGTDFNHVVRSWGDPEKKFEQTMAYWRRGVYIGVSQEGKIKYIFISSPGKFEGEK